MSLSKQQAPYIKKCECDLGFNGKSLWSKSDPDLIGNVRDFNKQLCKPSPPKYMIRRFPLAQSTDSEFFNEENIVKQGSKFKTASPSVIRKGLCIVRNESK